MEENDENPVKTQKNNKSLIICIIIAVVVVALAIGGYFVFYRGNNNNIAGQYELYEMTSGDESYTNEELESLKALGLKVTLELKEDHTGTLDLFGENMELTYDNKNMIVDGKAEPYTVKDDKITLEQEGEKLVFQKADKTENETEQK